jgi:hypothetical protein
MRVVTTVPVVGGAGHEVAGKILLEERHPERFEMTEHIPPEIVLDPAGNSDHQPPREELEDALPDGKPDDHQGIEPQLPGGDRRNLVDHVDPKADHAGTGQPENGRQDDGEESGDHADSITL